ncbi:ABC transporter permease [Gordonia sinesedis]
MTVTQTSARAAPRSGWLLAVGVLGLAVAGYLSLAIGVGGVGMRGLVTPTADEWHILLQSRIPRLLAVLLAGSALAVAGLVMQRITQNRFVSPSTSGTTEAAILGVLVATLVFGDQALAIRMLIAIVFAVIGTFGFLRLVNRVHSTDGLAVALIGLMYGGVIGAVATAIAYRTDLLQFLEMWTAGSFSGVLAGRFEPLLLVAPVTVLAYLYADRFTVVGMGHSFATNLGVDYHRVRAIGLFTMSVTAAVMVVVVGALPFLGLIVPNLVSMALGDNMRRVLPVTALAGAAFVLACDVAGRLIRYPYEVSASTLIGLIGGAVFIVLILRVTRGLPA